MIDGIRQLHELAIEVVPYVVQDPMIDPRSSLLSVSDREDGQVTHRR